MISQNTPNQLSRRNWLRDAAIATAGAAVLPSLLTSCSDHRIPPGVGTGAPPTTEELQRAAQNLSNMEAWRSDVYDWTFRYQDEVYHMINSGTMPSGWESFIVTVFTDIAIGIVTAAFLAAEVSFPFAAPAIALVGATITKWAIGQDSPSFPGVFAEFERGHQEVQFALSNTLDDLAGTYNNYSILRARWNEVYEFNDHKYTISDLALETNTFPLKTIGKPYTDLRSAAYDRFRKYIWNVMFVKCAKMYYVPYWNENHSTLLVPYAQNEHYPKHPETYLRGYYNGGDIFELTYFYFMIDGKYLSAETANELFMDDFPGHNAYNPTGLFHRDYVFKQFHREKPDFKGYFDVKPWSDHTSHPEKNLDPNSDNYVFTGGDFPQLVKLK